MPGLVTRLWYKLARMLASRTDGDNLAVNSYLRSIIRAVVWRYMSVASYGSGGITADLPN